MCSSDLPVKLVKASVSKDKQRLVCFGDLHHGAFNSDTPLALETLARYHPDAWFLGGGDYHEASTRYSIGAGVYEQNLNPQQQFDELAGMLEPYSGDFVGMLRGNHEDRLYKTVGFDMSKVLAKTLGIPYLNYSANLRLDVGSQRYIVFVTHGATGSTTRSGRMKAVEKLAEWNSADLFIYFHTHDSHLWSIRYRAYDSKAKVMKEHERWNCLAGSFLKYDGSYADMKNYPPLGMGVSVLELSGTEHSIKLIEGGGR